MTIVDRESDNHFFVWYDIDALKDSQYFVEVKVEEIAEGHLKIKVDYPSRDKIRELKQKTGKGHAPIFSSSKVVYDLKEVQEDDVVKTHIQYMIDCQSSRFLLRTFAGKVRAALRDTAQEVIAHL